MADSVGDGRTRGYGPPVVIGLLIPGPGAPSYAPNAPSPSFGRPRPRPVRIVRRIGMKGGSFPAFRFSESLS